MKIKKFLCAAVALAFAAVMPITATACSNSSDKIYVDTNAFFAPFEYYDGNDIVGVDIDIMNQVGKKLNKEVVFTNTDFGVIIDNVSKGTQFDCGAAGITITEARQELVDFSIPYFTSVQYVIFKNDTFSVSGTTTDGVDYILWEALAGKKIGVQTNTTGHIYVDGEINARESDPDYGYDGVLYNTNTELVTYSNANVAVSALGTGVDVVVVDKLPAEYIVKNNSSLKCYALYYDADTATEEQYAICVTKGNTELLDAINEVLTELGEEGINQLVSKHLGLTD
ncbi:MAG: transporter substrate-binding domain-containing protein [Candidatus Coproplasma sp.]